MILCFAFLCIVSIIGIQVYLHRLLQKRGFERQGHDVGAVLSKKAHHDEQTRFLITYRGHSHYYLQSQETGEKVLVSKDKVHEDFDLAL